MSFIFNAMPCKYLEKTLTEKTSKQIKQINENCAQTFCMFFTNISCFFDYFQQLETDWKRTATAMKENSLHVDVLYGKRLRAILTINPIHIEIYRANNV